MNTHRGEVDVKIGNATYTMRFDTNALAMLERESGVTITQLAGMGEDEEKAQSILGVSFVRAALYAGIKRDNKRLTIEKVGDKMELDQIGYYTERIVEALSLALGGPSGNVDAPGPEIGRMPGDGTGAESGGLGVRQ